MRIVWQLVYVEQISPLIEAAQIGDPAALDRLLRICQLHICRYARRNCLTGDLDDAVQETLLIPLRRVPWILCGLIAQAPLNRFCRITGRSFCRATLREDLSANWPTTCFNAQGGRKLPAPGTTFDA